MKSPTNTKLLYRIIISIILSIFILGCNLFSQIVPTTAPQSQITLSPSEGDSFYQISELELLNLLIDNSSDLPQFSILEPSIKLDNGVAELNAILQAKPSENNNPMITAFDGRINLQFSVTLDDSHLPVINIKQLTINDIPVPEIFLGQFSTLISTAITNDLQSSLGDKVIKSINIDDGFITVITGDN